MGTETTIGNTEYNAFLEAVANHEAKLLTLGLLAVRPDEWHTASNLRLAILEHQGEQPAWEDIDRRSILDYCERSFVSTGAVFHTTTHGHSSNEVATFRAHATKYLGYLGLTGAALAWSLEQPQTSVQTLLGSSASPTKTRAPGTRFALYEQLLEDKEHTVASLTQAVFGTKSRQDYVHHQVYHLASRGLLVSSDTVRPTIELASDSKHPISSFVHMMNEARQLTHSSRYQDIARKIIASPDNFNQLMAKAKQYSATASGQPETHTQAAILNILEQAGPLSTRQILNKVAALAGRQYSHETVYRHLQALVQTGTIERSEQTLNTNRGARRIIYQRH